MIFNSFDFAIFLIIVFAIYWLLRNKLAMQNVFIVLVSYFFYGWWDWRFLLLIALTSFCSFASALLIQHQRSRAEKLLSLFSSKHIAAINVVLNLCILCVFKYFNFFSDSFEALFSQFGITLGWVTLDIVLPVGISFYTFQAISYTIDVYRKDIEPTRDIVSFFAFVSFFPQLVAGPIERSTNLLPQFYSKRSFDYDSAVNGMRQILIGLFKKIAVADNCAVIVNDIFANYQSLGASTLLLGGVLFAFQIYGDFSGYSDIAIGVARLFGIELKKNFYFPYFSRDIAEFWRRWHISLNTWFRDYVYIPLGGSRAGTGSAIRNTFVIFLISGLWHGANWTFLAWGLYHALLFIPLLLLGRNRRYTDAIAAGRLLPSMGEFLRMGCTFLLVSIGWIIFRADNIHVAIDYLSALLDPSLFSIPTIETMSSFGYAIFAIVILLLLEWSHRHREFGLDMSHSSLPRFLRRVIYMMLLLYTFYFGGAGDAFIYFQF